MGLEEAKRLLIEEIKSSSEDIKLNQLYKKFFCQILKDDYDAKKEKWRRSPMKMYIIEEIGLEVDTTTAPGHIRLDQFEKNIIPDYVQNILGILFLQQQKIKQLEEKISKLNLN